MAENLHTTIMNGEFEVDHGPYKITVPLPIWMLGFRGKMTGRVLLDHFNSLSDSMKVGLLHVALAAIKITIRSRVRAVAGEKDGKKQSWVGKELEARKASTEFIPSEIAPPSERKETITKKYNSLVDELNDAKDRGASPEEVFAIITKYQK